MSFTIYLLVCLQLISSQTLIEIQYRSTVGSPPSTQKENVEKSQIMQTKVKPDRSPAVSKTKHQECGLKNQASSISTENMARVTGEEAVTTNPETSHPLFSPITLPMTITEPETTQTILVAKQPELATALTTTHTEPETTAMTQEIIVSKPPEVTTALATADTEPETLATTQETVVSKPPEVTTTLATTVTKPETLVTTQETVVSEPPELATILATTITEPETTVANQEKEITIALATTVSDPMVSARESTKLHKTVPMKIESTQESISDLFVMDTPTGN